VTSKQFEEVMCYSWLPSSLHTYCSNKYIHYVFV